MVDRLFSEPALAGLYDLFCALEPRGDFSFYLPLVMSAEAVLGVAVGRARCSIALGRPAIQGGSVGSTPPA